MSRYIDILSIDFLDPTILQADTVECTHIYWLYVHLPGCIIQLIEHRDTTGSTEAMPGDTTIEAVAL